MYFALPNVLQGLFKVHTCMLHATLIIYVHSSSHGKQVSMYCTVLSRVAMYRTVL